MAPHLLSQSEFERRLSGEVTDPLAMRAFFAHYCVLGRWNEKLSLMARGDVDHVVERHYLDCFRGAALVPRETRVAVDVGSGAGFPGLVLAVALPGVEFTLVESRQKKWAFLKRAAAAAGVKVRCIHASVGRDLPKDLPQRIDLITIRALRLSMPVWESLVSRLTPTGHVVVWAGASPPSLPESLVLVDERLGPDADHRRILRFARVSP